MDKKSLQIADAMPIDGDFLLEEQFSVSRKHVSTAGDLIFSDFELT